MMIKSILERGFILLFLLVNLSSCASVDKEEQMKPTPESMNLYGIYEGTLIVDVQTLDGKSTSKSELPNHYIEVNRRNVDSELLLRLSNFIWNEEELGNIDVPAHYEIKDQNCSLEAYRQLQLTDIGQCNLNLVGGIKEEQLNFDIQVEIKQGDFKVVVSFTGKSSHIVLKTFRFGFEQWFIANPIEAAYMQYKLPVATNGVVWQSTDREVSQLRWLGMTNQLSVVSNGAHVEGDLSAEVRTLAVTGSNELKIPSVYGGQLFWGEYSYNQENPQKGIRLGLPFDQEPLSLKGYYSYKPGEIYYHCPDPKNMANLIIDEQKQDSLLIRAVLYSVENLENENEMLGLHEFFDSPRIVAEANFTDSELRKEFEPFDVKFRYKEGFIYKEEYFYRIALYITSSKEGRFFSGAPGSVVRVDELEITTRKKD